MLYDSILTPKRVLKIKEKIRKGLYVIKAEDGRPQAANDYVTKLQKIIVRLNK